MSDLSLAESLLLYVLTFLVRFITKRQATRLLGFQNPNDTERVIQSLVKKGLLLRGFALCPTGPGVPELMFARGADEQPLSPEDKSLRFSQLHNRIKKRAAETLRQAKKPLRFPIIAATERAASLFGGVIPDLSKFFQWDHDRIVAELIVEAVVSNEQDVATLVKSLLAGEVAIHAHGVAALSRLKFKGRTSPIMPLGVGGTMPLGPDGSESSPAIDNSPLIDRQSPLDGGQSTLISVPHSHAGFADFPESFSITNGLDRRWRGEGYLNRFKLRLNAYVPDFAVVVGGRIVHAVDVATQNYGKKRLVEIYDSSVDNQVSLEIYA